MSRKRSDEHQLVNAGRTEITIFSVQDRINFYRNLSLVIESQTVSKCYDWNDVKTGNFSSAGQAAAFL